MTHTKTTTPAIDVLAMLGSFWAFECEDRGLLAAAVTANLVLLEQQHQNIDELIACQDRHSVPLYHTEHWLPIVLAEADGLEGYGWELPEAVIWLPSLQNRITEPSLTWRDGSDYVIENGKLVLTSDPFDNPLLPVSGGEIVLWAQRAQLQCTYMRDYYAPAIELPVMSPAQYKRCVNAIIDISMYGPSVTAVHVAIQAFHGLP
ncbi:unnamed protein product, partial [marine sediment metagenome]